MENKMNRMLFRLQCQLKVMDNIKALTDNVLGILDGAPYNEWWAKMLLATPQEKDFIIVADGMPKDSNSIKNFILKSQIEIKAREELEPKFFNSIRCEINYLKDNILPPASDLKRFLHGKTKEKPSLDDCWLYVCFIFWIDLRYFIFLHKRLEKNWEDYHYDDLVKDVNTSFDFLGKHIAWADDEYLDFIVDANNFYTSPEFIYTEICLEFFGDIVALCSKNANIVSHIDLNNTIGQPVDVSELSTHLPSEFLEMIEAKIGQIVLKYSLDETKVMEIRKEIVELFNNGVNLEELLLWRLAKQAELANKHIRFYKPILNCLFVILNTSFYDKFDKEKIIQLFSNELVGEKVQKQYNKFCKEFSWCDNDIVFYDSDDDSSLNEIIWEGIENRDKKCLHVGLTPEIAKDLFQKLRGIYIDEHTKCKDLIHVLTGLPIRNGGWDPINWISEEKQGLAFFIGIFFKRNSNKEIGWKEASRLFLFHRKEIVFNSSTQYHQAIKSGKYNALSEFIEKTLDRAKIRKET